MRRKNIKTLLLTAIFCVTLAGCNSAPTDTETTETFTTQAETDIETEENITEEAIESKEETEVSQIIEHASSYNTTDNVYTWEMFCENPQAFFPTEHNQEVYTLLLEDIDEQTNSAQEQVIKLYNNIDELFPDDCTTYEFGNVPSMVFHYYRYIKSDFDKANMDISSGST